ncbi:MAG: acyl--CoA ligase [Rhodospirillaceae bacterium]|nr:acyl--CoA ligase [Rhodospirillaceae bacterium]
MNRPGDQLGEIRPFEMTVDAMFRRAVAHWPKRPFVIADGTRISYAEMEAHVEQSGRGLLALGVAPGDRVALWMSNIWEWIVVQLAVTRMGAVLTPINTRLRVDDMGHILRDCGATVLFTQGASKEFSYVEVMGEILTALGPDTSLRHVVVARSAGSTEVLAGAMPQLFVTWDDFMAGAEAIDDAPHPATDPGELAYILYTSGTTSLPKGVMLSHACLNHAINIAGAFQDGDITFLVYPLFAITGCHNAVLKSILLGGCIVMQERFEAAEALALIERHGCTVIGCIINVLDEIAALPDFDATQVASLRIANVFPRRPEHLDLLQRFGVAAATTGYGMTETTGPVSFIADLDPASMTSEGRPWPGDEVRLLREDGGEAEVGEDGAIIVRTRHNMIGYFNNPEATAKTIDQDGWLHTGDIGRWDAQGRLTWVGRANDIIKSSGFNFASQEVEAYLSRHAAVEEVAIVGVPDRGKGEVAAAFVVPNTGMSMELEAMRAFCAGQIASYKIPGHLFIRNELPKTASGKVRKVELKAWFLER